jgi:hypothetical protein
LECADVKESGLGGQLIDLASPQCLLAAGELSLTWVFLISRDSEFKKDTCKVSDCAIAEATCAAADWQRPHFRLQIDSLKLELKIETFGF